jgi:hypothetical protein
MPKWLKRTLISLAALISLVITVAVWAYIHAGYGYYFVAWLGYA